MVDSKEPEWVMDAEVTWNFQKFMVDENGKLVGFLKPKESVNSEKIDNWITGK